jgi:predicted component of type VI protein secretion system
MSFLNQFLSDPPQDDTLRSVVRNLSYLLNAKSGYGSPLGDFGLGDYYVQQGTLATAESVMREILSEIDAYEPRLRPRKIEIRNDGEFPLLIELQGELQVRTGRPLAPREVTTPCRLGILFNPILGEVVIEVLEVADVR